MLLPMFSLFLSLLLCERSLLRQDDVVKTHSFDNNVPVHNVVDFEEGILLLLLLLLFEFCKEVGGDDGGVDKPMDTVHTKKSPDVLFLPPDIPYVTGIK